MYTIECILVPNLEGHSAIVLVTMDLSELITELEISRQQKDTLEVELLARTRENTILKSRLQELIDYGEGLEVKMPGQWSIEEQTKVDVEGC